MSGTKCNPANAGGLKTTTEHHSFLTTFLESQISLLSPLQVRGLTSEVMETLTAEQSQSLVTLSLGHVCCTCPRIHGVPTVGVLTL